MSILTNPFLAGTAGGGAGVYPSVISTKVVGWWDAGHTTDDGTNVLTLVDQSPVGNNLAQATSGNRVALANVATVSSKTVFQVASGTKSYFLDPLTAGSMPSITDVALAAICKPDATTQKVAMQIGTDASSKGIGLAPNTSGSKFGALVNNVAWADSEDAVDTTTRHFYLCVRSGSVLRFYRNGKPLFPINGDTPGTGYTKVSAMGADHNFLGDWRAGGLLTALTDAEVSELATWCATNESTANDTPASTFHEDDDFATGSSIDTGGTRAGSAIAWTAFNSGGSITNAQSGGTCSMTLPQSSSDIYRGWTQPDPNTDTTTYTWVSAKIIPANITTQNGHHAALALMDTVGGRMLAIVVGYESSARHIGIARHYAIASGGDFDGYQNSANQTGFTSGDWDAEWTLHMAWNKTDLNCWYQIGAAAPVFLGDVSTSFFNSGLRGNKVGLLVSSGNASGGNTVADWTDFKRHI